MTGKEKNKKVIVAMSGGIDSSVAAALLKRAGFDVAGVFMRLFSGEKSKMPEARAKKVAKILKIPFYVLNFEKEFGRRVVNYFLNENKKGLTPNPCIVCNKEIKFGLLLEKSLELKADYIATGHYARIVKGKLYTGKDKERDQSYFLWKLGQNQLKRVLFPIGNCTKKEVEKLAGKLKLSFLVKIPKSQEICFIENKLEAFLKKRLGIKSGNIVDSEGKTLGRHRGLWFYTIGQRKGIGFSGGPYYVLGKDLKKNLLIVDKNERNLYKEELVLKRSNWVSGKRPKLPLIVKVKIRYRHSAAPAVLGKRANLTILKFKKKQRAITPGQSAVFYKGSEVLGGGIIY
ncbi:MAG: tRNA 2-thiouridine(34) synthase MnmA [Candidatus Nealsonbacteria bacterium]|nr:tRNA 2-thiouridine(34) synthase MnmA [Candidatus Nealsonbacteria bacterium]